MTLLTEALVLCVVGDLTSVLQAALGVGGTPEAVGRELESPAVRTGAPVLTSIPCCINYLRSV